MPVKPLDLDFARSEFPALDGSCLYFDNAGGSQTLGRVVDRISDYLLHTNVQLGASYAVAQRAAERVAEATRGVASLLHAGDSHEVVFGGSSTQLLANLALATAETLRPGDEVVVTNADHESNIGPWRRLASRGVRVRTWEVRQDTWTLEPEDLEPLLSERTRLVCFTHASNILGAVTPVSQVVRLVHDCGAKVLVDGVALAPHRAVDVRAWDVDFYVFSFYKLFGPHHAVLFGKREALLGLGNINHEFLGPEAVPYKLQPGKFNFELTYGLLGIVDYLDELGSRVGDPPSGMLRGRIEQAFEAIAEHEEMLVAPLLSYLAGRRGVRLVGPASAARDVRLPIVGFTVEGRSSSTVPPQLDGHGIGVRFGHFYSKRLIDDLGLAEQDGVVRISMAHYNTAEEVDILLRRLDEALGS
jgi:cysteine desulfurase family protein (TIGR01976 family)